MVCARGVVDRIVKSAEVERAGGIGMVLANLTPNTLDADLHSVPTVHVDPPASTAITAYAATAGATATLTEGNETSTDLAYPQIATFSARGPSVGTGGDTLKPDLVAPGVSILGAVAPPGNDGQELRVPLRYVGVRAPGRRPRGAVVRSRGATDLVADERSSRP